MNRYWVGRKDSERVLGFDPARGPFSQLMSFVRALATQHQQQLQLQQQIQQQQQLNPQQQQRTAPAADSDPSASLHAAHISMLRPRPHGSTVSSPAVPAA